MKIVVINGPLSEKEQDAYIRHVTSRCPASAIDTLYMEVHADHVDLRCTRHRYRELRKMGGYCISEPDTWNSAKQAEHRDTVPNTFKEAAS